VQRDDLVERGLVYFLRINAAGDVDG